QLGDGLVEAACGGVVERTVAPTADVVGEADLECGGRGRRRGFRRRRRRGVVVASTRGRGHEQGPRGSGGGQFANSIAEQGVQSPSVSPPVQLLSPACRNARQPCTEDSSLTVPIQTCTPVRNWSVMYRTPRCDP